MNSRDYGFRVRAFGAPRNDSGGHAARFPLPLVGRGRGGGREVARDRRRLQGANIGPCDRPPDPHPDALRASTLPTRGRVMFIVLALRFFLRAPSVVHNAKKRAREIRSSSDAQRRWGRVHHDRGAVTWASASADAHPTTNDQQKIKTGGGT